MIYDEEDEWGCVFPGECCMAYTDHMKGECYTPEMYEDYVREEEDDD